MAGFVGRVFGHRQFTTTMYTFRTHQSRLAHSDSSLSNTISTPKQTLTNAKRLR